MSKVITNCSQCEHFDPDPKEPSCRKMEAEGSEVYESLLSWEDVRRNVIPSNCPLKSVEATNNTAMNKRINELAEQARKYADDNEQHWKSGPSWDSLFEAKFAELIVGECVSLFDGSEEMKTVGFLSHKQIVDKIEEHFRS